MIHKRIITIDIIWLLSLLPNPARPSWYLKSRLFNRFSSSTMSRNRTEWPLSGSGRTRLLWLSKLRLITPAPSLIRRDKAIFAGVSAIAPFLWIGGYFMLRDSRRLRSEGRFQSLAMSHNSANCRWRHGMMLYSAISHSYWNHEFRSSIRRYRSMPCSPICHRNLIFPSQTKICISEYRLSL